VEADDVVAVREGSKQSGPFAQLSDDAGVRVSWLTFDRKQFAATKTTEPTYEPTETLFDVEQVLEYYSR
jgi:ribosomal protein S4